MSEEFVEASLEIDCIGKNTMKINVSGSNHNEFYILANCKIYKFPHDNRVLLMPDKYRITNRDILFKDLFNMYKGMVDGGELELIHNPKECYDPIEIDLSKSKEPYNGKLPSEIRIPTSMLNGANLDPKIKELRVKLD